MIRQWMRGMHVSPGVDAAWDILHDNCDALLPIVKNGGKKVQFEMHGAIVDDEGRFPGRLYLGECIDLP